MTARLWSWLSVAAMLTAIGLSFAGFDQPAIALVMAAVGLIAIAIACEARRG